MPTIIYKQNAKLTPEDMAKVVVYADHVEKNCFDEFPGDGSKSVSAYLSDKVKEVREAFNRPDTIHGVEDLADRLMALKSHVGTECFDKFDSRGSIGKTMELLNMSFAVSEVIDKMVIYHLSEEELDAADAEIEQHDGGFAWVDDGAPEQAPTVH